MRRPLLLALLAVVAPACTTGSGTGDDTTDTELPALGDWTAVIAMPDSGTCAPASEVDPDSLTLVGCEIAGDVTSVSGEGTPTRGYCDTGGPDDYCSYPVEVRGLDTEDQCVCGRPFVVEGETRTAPIEARSDWTRPASPRLDHLTADERAALADRWAKIGAAEHASVASFARFTLHLMSLGAPAELVRAAQQAALDEVRHAELAFGLASAYAGRTLGPGPLAVDGSVAPASLAELAAAVVIEGCVGETLSAIQMAEDRAVEADPEVAAILDRIVRDEERHAELAWKTVRWALDIGGPDVRDAVQGAFATARPQTMSQGWASVVEPVAAALVG